MRKVKDGEWLVFMTAVKQLVSFTFLAKVRLMRHFVLYSQILHSFMYWKTKETGDADEKVERQNEKLYCY